MSGLRRAAQAAHPGGRPVQQDRVACLSTPDGRAHLLVLADGMGGAGGGEEAAAAVIDTAIRLWGQRSRAPEDAAGLLDALCAQAHEQISRLNQSALARGGAPGGATIAALLATPQRAWWVHVGDSRVYGFRGGRPVCRTEDHTVVEQLVRQGHIEPAAAGAHPAQHQLLRVLGSEQTPQPGRGQMQMDADTGFVLCSDGFWTQVTAGEMAGLLDSADPARACAQWAGEAARRGGVAADNVSVAVLQPALASASGLGWRQLWPLYAALALALVAGVVQFSG